MSPSNKPPCSSTITLDVCGERIVTPQRESLLQCLLSRRPEHLLRGDYCQSGECAHCEVSIWLHGDEQPRKVLACCYKPVTGLTVTDLSRYLQVDLGRQ